jgi:hypothetical protein
MIKLVFYPLSLCYNNDWWLVDGNIGNNIESSSLNDDCRDQVYLQLVQSFLKWRCRLHEVGLRPQPLLKKPMLIDSHITTRLNRTRPRRSWRPYIWQLILFSNVFRFCLRFSYDGTKYTEVFEKVFGSCARFTTDHFRTNYLWGNNAMLNPQNRN